MKALKIQKCTLRGNNLCRGVIADTREFNAVLQERDEVLWALRELYTRFQPEIQSKNGPAEFAELVKWLKANPLTPLQTLNRPLPNEGETVDRSIQCFSCAINRLFH